MSSAKDYEACDGVIRSELVGKLFDGGNDAGITRNKERALVVWYRDHVWRVMGGSAERPSLKMAPELKAADVDWVDSGKERVDGP